MWGRAPARTPHLGHAALVGCMGTGAMLCCVIMMEHADPPAPPSRPTPSRVALARCADYAPGNIERAVAEVIDLLGGIGRFVRPGARVLLKPNLIAAHPPEAAATTHPEVAAAVARIAAGAGGRVEIGDSPGVKTLPVVADATGIAAVASRLGLPLVEFTEPVEAARPKGARFRKLPLARPAVEADVLINLPKVKTHQQMFLTLAVKNLFGCVVGRQKIAWHMSAGRDAALFARVLVEICSAVAPALSIADGVVGMEGTGPCHGRPRQFGFIAASADPFALDAVLTSLLGFEDADVPVLAAARAARADGLRVGETDLDKIELAGCAVGELRPGRVTPPTMGRLMFVPGFLSGLMRRLATARPSIDHKTCRVCGVCAESCPAGAMKIIDRRVRIDDTSCIRCFCCQELCPHGAVGVRRGLLSRLFSR